MPITIPPGIVPVKTLTTGDILYGDRTTSYRWEVLTHSAGVDTLLGFLDGVVLGSSTISGQLNTAVKLSGSVKVDDLETPQAGFLRIRDLELGAVRLRPVLVVEGLPEIPLGVYLITTVSESWTDTGRVLGLDIHDKSTVLDQDAVDQSYSVDTSTKILSAISSVISGAGESIVVDGTVTTILKNPMVWPAGTTKLQIVNDLLRSMNYKSLTVDGTGAFEAAPYVLPAKRSASYELLGLPRELIDGPTSIYSREWGSNKDLYAIPNKVIAVQSASGTAAALTGTYTNTDPNSPFSYVNRGNRWVTSTISGVATPADTDANVIAFLENVAQRSLIAQSSPQATVQVKCLPIPIRVGDVIRFANSPAGIDRSHVIDSFSLDANPLGLMSLSIQELLTL